MQTFPYPVGLAVFNRPTYHQALLESLTRQSLPMDMALVVAHLDSYEGSRDQSVRRPDFTQTTSEFIGQYLDLPESQVIRAQHNRGVARSLTALERALFEVSDARWVLVIEGDMVLFPRALEVIHHCIQEAQSHPSVAVINFDYADWPQTDTRFNFVRGHGTRIYALSRDHHRERMPVIDAFNALLEDQSYHTLSYEQVLQAVAPLGVYPSNALQDATRTATSVAFGRLQIAPKVRIAAHVGVYGQSNIYVDGRIPALPDFGDLSEAQIDMESLRLTRANLYWIRWEIFVRRVRVLRKLSLRSKWTLISARGHK